MIYLASPSRTLEAVSPKSVFVTRELRLLLIVEAAVLGTVGAFLVLNPEFVSTFWHWTLRPLGARIIAAWFLGWAVWAGTLAFGRNWDEIRIGVGLNILWGLALVVSMIVFFPLFDFSRAGTIAYAAGAVIFTLLLILLFWQNHRRATTA